MNGDRVSLRAEDITKSFRRGGSTTPVLQGVTVEVGAGEVVSLVGESGSGKSTLLRCIVGLQRPDSGRILYRDAEQATRAGQAVFHREVQIVFQDPYSSLSPRMTVQDIVSEGVIVHRLESSRRRRLERTVEALEQVGLSAADLPRYPSSFSGGQRQRIAIARALAVRPRILICDEPVSALDVSVQAQVLNVIQSASRNLGLGVLFISHNLAVVRHLSDRVAILRDGRIVEEGVCDEVYASPSHPYTKALLAAVPVPDPAAERRRREARGESDPRFAPLDEGEER